MATVISNKTQPLLKDTLKLIKESSQPMKRLKEELNSNEISNVSEIRHVEGMGIVSESLQNDDNIEQKKDSMNLNDYKEYNNDLGTDKNIPINKQVEIPQNTLKQSFSKDDIPSTFDKLYKESEKKKRNLIKREIISQEIELEGCTFSPNILVTSSNNSEIYKTESSPYERLYKDFQKRNESLKQRQKELAEENHRLSSMVFTNVPGCKTRNKETGDNQKEDKNYIKKEKPNIAPGNMKTGFERLYEMDKIYKANKVDLSKRVMQEMGVSFAPKINKVHTTSSYTKASRILEKKSTFISTARNNNIVSTPRSFFNK